MNRVWLGFELCMSKSNRMATAPDANRIPVKQIGSANHLYYYTRVPAKLFRTIMFA